MSDRRDPTPPANSYIFGYLAMAPLVLAAIGAWVLPAEWPAVMARLATVWAALVLAYIGGVRRGFGFAVPAASTANEIVVSLTYFALGGLALIALPYYFIALWPLAVGLALAALLDTRGARQAQAPAHFATLRPPQMLLGCLAIVVLWLRAVL